MPKYFASASAPAYTPAHSVSNIQAIGIVISAQNHCATIATCIASIFAANSRSGWRNSLWIVVVVDGCTDDTAQAAREALGAFGQVLEICAHSRQDAHQLGVTTVMDHFHGVPRHTLLLTSADAAVDLPGDWIDRQIKCAHSPLGLATNY